MRTSSLLVAGALLLPACKDKGDTGSVTPLGPFTTDTGGLTPVFTVEVPDDAESSLLKCGPWGYDDLGTTWEIRDPDGGLYYANAINERYADKPMRSGVMDDTLPVLFPVSPDATQKKGGYEFQIWVASGGQPTTFDCELLHRTDKVSSNAEIDLHFVFVGASGVDASTAGEDDTFQGVVAKVDQYWGGVDLRVGNVTYEDFSGNTSKYSVIDYDSNEPGELYETVELDPGRKLTVFVVDSIESSDGSEILGIAAGPPGAATLGGNSKAGMIVGTADYASDPDYTAQVIAHEGAHFLGLFHTTEKDGSQSDPLSDTAACPASNDANSDGVMSPTECAGKGADNLMFWAPQAGSSTALTSDQSWVLRRNPAVK